MNNPMFSNINGNQDAVYSKSDCASYKGITIKTLILLFVSIASAAAAIASLYTGVGTSVLLSVLIGSGILGFITVLIGRMSPRASAVCGILYAIGEGAFLGALSLLLNLVYEGIALVAIISTIVVFCAMLGVFASGIIRNKSKIYSFTVTLGISLILMALVMLIMSIFPVFNSIMNNLGVMIAVEALFIIYACAMLLTNFNEAQELVKGGCDKSYEWCCAFGLLISILYIYIEVLRLLLILFQIFGDRN